MSASSLSLSALVATAPDAVDFSSNDYLGLARDPALHREVLAEWQRLGSDPCAKQQLIGSTGSRLLSGNTAEHERLEAWLAAFHGHEAALLFNSGYDANLALLACVPAPGDAVLYDEARATLCRSLLPSPRGARHDAFVALARNSSRTTRCAWAFGSAGSVSRCRSSTTTSITSSHSSRAPARCVPIIASRDPREPAKASRS